MKPEENWPLGFDYSSSDNFISEHYTLIISIIRSLGLDEVYYWRLISTVINREKPQAVYKDRLLDEEHDKLEKLCANKEFRKSLLNSWLWLTANDIEDLLSWFNGNALTCVIDFKGILEPYWASIDEIIENLRS